MKMTVAFLIALFLLTTRVLVAGAAIRYEQDATPNGAATFDIPGAALTSNQESSYDEMLMANGVDPGSNKARVIVAWMLANVVAAAFGIRFGTAWNRSCVGRFISAATL